MNERTKCAHDAGHILFVPTMRSANAWVCDSTKKRASIFARIIRIVSAGGVWRRSEEN
jgi:hypothetical protein